MAIAINGTTGISGVDGSASAPALQGVDSNTGVSFGTDTVNINTGGTTRATVDSSGNVGIGTTSPAQKLDVTSTNNIAYALDGWALAGKGDSSDILFGGISGSQFDTLAFYTSGSESMRIDSSGRLLLGTTSPTEGVSTGHLVSTFAGNADIGLKCRDTTGGSVNHVVFVSTSNVAGLISGNSSSVSYGTSSDYRLKENVTAISDGITRLKTLKPSRFNFKVDKDTTVDGFLAHEVTAVPEAITGTKDQVATDNDVGYTTGDPIYQSIDQSKLVPLLTAALQEAIGKIEILETKVAALEAI